MSSISFQTSLGLGGLAGAGWEAWKHYQNAQSQNQDDAVAKIGKGALKGAACGIFCYFMIPAFTQSYKCWIAEPEHACIEMEKLSILVDVAFGWLSAITIKSLSDWEPPQTAPTPDTPFPDESSSRRLTEVRVSSNEEASLLSSSQEASIQGSSFSSPDP